MLKQEPLYCLLLLQWLTVVVMVDVRTLAHDVLLAAQRGTGLSVLM